MAHVIASRRLRFVDAEGEHDVIPSPTAQPFPDRFVGTPYYLAASASGWITQVELEPKAEEPTPKRRRNVLS